MDLASLALKTSSTELDLTQSASHTEDFYCYSKAARMHLANRMLREESQSGQGVFCIILFPLRVSNRRDWSVTNGELQVPVVRHACQYMLIVQDGRLHHAFPHTCVLYSIIFIPSLTFFPLPSHRFLSCPSSEPHSTFMDSSYERNVSEPGFFHLM